MKTEKGDWLIADDPDDDAPLYMTADTSRGSAAGCVFGAFVLMLAAVVLWLVVGTGGAW